jgi:hypothetical protein
MVRGREAAAARHVLWNHVRLARHILADVAGEQAAPGIVAAAGAEAGSCAAAGVGATAVMASAPRSAKAPPIEWADRRARVNIVSSPVGVLPALRRPACHSSRSLILRSGARQGQVAASLRHAALIVKTLIAVRIVLEPLAQHLKAIAQFVKMAMTSGIRTRCVS